MTSRTRTHEVISRVYESNQTPPVQFRVYETITESSYPGSCSVSHWRTEKFINMKFIIPGSNPPRYQIWENVNPTRAPLPQLPNTLNWNKLPTSTEASIISILAEIDDTIATFTLKFWKSLSYGSVTWGILPLVSDLKAVLKALQTLFVDLSKFSYEDSYTLESSFSFNDSGDLHAGTISSVFHLTGTGDLSFQHPISLMLDKLGFHPSLLAIWDLIPFSFVVDYLLPVGDFLDSIRGGNWVKAMAFKGWVTRKCKVNGTITVPAGAKTDYSYVTFHRWPASLLLLHEPKTDVAFELPSLRECFNIWYLVISGLSGKF